MGLPTHERSDRLLLTCLTDKGRVVRLYIWILEDERGASMVEYALLVLFIAMAALIAITASGNELSETYSEISSALVETGN
jgi:Flp pilus assembly pilin Flp